MAEKSNQVVAYPGPFIKADELADRINALHFRGAPVLVELRNLPYDYPLLLKAKPEICRGKHLRACWEEPDEVPDNLHQFRLAKVVIPDMTSSVELTTANGWLEHDALQIEIPAKLQTISSRAACRRASGPGVAAQLIQHGVCFAGRLADFSPVGMRLELELVERQSIYMFNPDQDVTLNLEVDGKTVFAGPVAILRSDGGPERYTVVVAPTENCTPRYQPKQERTSRHVITPPPDINFTHPLTGERTTLPVRDIAILGLSVTEDPSLALLMPGLIIEDIALNVCGSPLATFSAQVVYRQTSGNQIACGLAILDISVEDHDRLTGLVHHAEDNHAYVRLNQNPEKFFEFLFRTGFLYPSKYEEIDKNREAFLESYRKLYLNPQRIARCFVYLDNGQILGHVSALKIYRRTWLNHHHAAIKSRRAGLKVLRQISDFHTKSFMLNPLHMRYVAGIWRPANDFPAKFFGRFAEELGNPQLCSMDTFSYFKVELNECCDWEDLRGPWEVAKANRQDIREFEGYYGQKSGGLLTKAFDLTRETFEDKSVAEEYADSGLKRNRFIYAVRYGVELKALVDVQDTDIGLNMSELTSAIYIYVLDENMVTPKILEFIQCVMAVKTQRESTAVMLYPHTYAGRYQMATEKDYCVWILNLNVAATDAYTRHLSKYTSR